VESHQIYSGKGSNVAGGISSGGGSVAGGGIGGVGVIGIDGCSKQ
jgi:hypothetical protein